MMRLILSLPLLFQAVNGVAHPAITPAAVLDKRQQQVLSTVWGPVLNQGTVSYKLYPCSSGSTLAASGTQWNCCPSSGTCYMASSCSAGTVFLAGTSLACSSIFSNTASNRCGTDILYSSVGGTTSWKKIFCAGATDSLTEFYFIQSPTSLPATTSSDSSSSASATPTSPSNNGKSKTPIGAIVGGVVGGIAVIALIVVGVFLLLKRKKKSKATTAAPATQPEAQHYPPAGGIDPKHNSYASAYPTSAPGSPPPMYQHNPANQAYYGHSEMGSPPAGAAYSVDNKAPLPSPGMTAPAPYQPQYGAPGPANGAYEMSAGSPTTHRGAVELPVGETSGTR